MNNLFALATKELSQDAFLRWLFENYDSDNPQVRKAAYTLLGAFTGLPLPDGSIKALQTYAQEYNIDVIVDFCVDDRRYLVAVEDKVFCGEHDNQLWRYRKKLSDVKDSFRGRPYDKAFYVFYKTDIENEDDRKAAEHAGWKCWFIREIHELFHRLPETADSEILDQYRAFIEYRYAKMSDISKAPVTEWDALDFRTYLLKEIVPTVKENIPHVFCEWHWGNWQGQYYSLLLTGKPAVDDVDGCRVELELLPRPYGSRYQVLVRVSFEGELHDREKTALRDALTKDSSVFRPRWNKWCIAVASKEMEDRLQYERGQESHTAALLEIVKAFAEFCRQH